MNDKIKLPSIHQLRKSNYKCRIIHKRYYEGYGLLSKREMEDVIFQKHCKSRISPKGGCTLIEITTSTGENFKSEAVCSQKDSFNRRIGLQICLGRISKVHKFQIKE